VTPTTPYSPHLEGRDPLAVMADSIARFERFASWADAQFDRPWAPGKWTARQILIHLAETEIALGSRARFALTTPNYTAQPFDQAKWIETDEGMTGQDALRALTTLMRMNHQMYSRLSSAQREIRFAHAEYGAISVDWILHQQAGHHVHHLKQLDAID
jgi:hypothetical protein